MSVDLISRRAEALFVSDVQPSDNPTPAEVRTAIVASIRSHGGVRGCAADMAAAYGRCPEAAAARMRWALALVTPPVPADASSLAPLAAPTQS